MFFEKSNYASQIDRNNLLFGLMDRIDYRRIVSEEDIEAVGWLRSRAFNAYPIYVEKFVSAIIDPLDHHPQTKLFGVYLDGQLAASMRLNFLQRGGVETPAMVLFRDVLQPLLDQGMRFVDPSRLAVDPAISAQVPALPLITHRLSTSMTLRYLAGYCLCVVRPEHEAYYRRVFRATRLAGPRPFEGTTVNVHLLGISVNKADYIKQRNPIFNFMHTETRLLFDTPAGEMPPLTVRPTARLAAQASRAA